MDLYIYRTPNGYIADFRPYLDGRDNSFEDRRPLAPKDPRWEKVANLRDPETEEPIGGKLELAGRARSRWHELMMFPLAWDGPFEPAEPLEPAESEPAER
ncbi:MAG: hypothetical protein HY721_26015 [Planctomycetes bacterium]|nr:hypothetical protein [Planctomycetota bacterium]